jgi:hypothetical protein
MSLPLCPRSHSPWLGPTRRPRPSSGVPTSQMFASGPKHRRHELYRTQPIVAAIPARQRWRCNRQIWRTAPMTAREIRTLFEIRASARRLLRMNPVHSQKPAASTPFSGSQTREHGQSNYKGKS